MVPFFWASSSIAESLFAGSGIRFADVIKQIDETLKPRSQFFSHSQVRIQLDISRKQTVSANLLGMIPGSDPELKKEFVIIGAHLDHVGMNDQGYVFNGADDNGSGSVGVLQAAKAFALNPVKPKRSILFAHWTGEEKGLLGSRHFVAFPPVPLSDIVACINLDMICKDTALSAIMEDVRDLGFDKDQLSRYPDEPRRLVAAFVSKPSPSLGDTSVRLGEEHCGLVVVPLPSYPMLGNSDHFPFSQKGVPSVFFNTEGHRDLHQPGDTVEKINAKKMSQIVKLSYLLAFSIADAQGKPVWKNR
jgi:Zn-dependent M28 family amino/carboxypeptidase